MENCCEHVRTEMTETGICFRLVVVEENEKSEKKIADFLTRTMPTDSGTVEMASVGSLY